MTDVLQATMLFTVSNTSRWQCSLCVGAKCTGRSSSAW